MTRLATPPAAPPPSFPVRRFSVGEYHRMIAAGILAEDEPIELLDGWIVTKMPKNPRHDAVIDLLSEFLRAQCPAGWRIRVQSAITTDSSEPEPDVALVRGPALRYKGRHPGPEDIALVVEVADSSLTRDREEKARIYGAAGIPAYWVVDLVHGAVEAFQEPSSSGGYGQRTVHAGADAVRLELDGTILRIPVAELFA